MGPFRHTAWQSDQEGPGWSPITATLSTHGILSQKQLGHYQSSSGAGEGPFRPVFSKCDFVSMRGN